MGEHARRQLELLAFTAPKPEVGAHGSRIVGQSEVQYLRCNCPTNQTDLHSGPQGLCDPI